MLFLFLFALFAVFSAAVAAPTREILPPYGNCLYDGLTMADSDDPAAFFVCCDHLWLLRYCSRGEIFDKYKLTCVPSFAPPTPIVAICVPGDRIADMFDASKYEECVNGTAWVARWCLKGAVFNANTKTCEFQSTTPVCHPGDTLPDPSGDVTKYLFCFRDGWKQEQCLAGFVYDPSAKTCVSKPPPTTTTTTTPLYDGPCQESAGADGYRPNVADCRTYFQCVHSRWMLRDCGPGTMWRQDILACDYYTGSC